MYLNRVLEVTDNGGCLSHPEEWGDFQAFWHHCLGWESLEEPKSEITSHQEIILREDISFTQAKEEIIDFIKQNGGEIFISEIIHKLRLDLELVIEIIDQLFDEGYIDRTD